MDLIIVESPTKARTLGKFLGSKYQVAASFGHVRDLPERKIGVDPEHNFEPVYVQTDKQKERIKEIKRFSDEAEAVYLATDPDREGEAIAFHVREMLQAPSSKKQETSKSKAKIQKSSELEEKFKRIEFHEITQSAIEQALAHPRKIDVQLVDAQQARRVLDRLVGYKLSPLLWRKVRRGLSAGRVQSVAVRLVVEKEKEIEDFKPVEYWNVDVLLETGISNIEYRNPKQIQNSNNQKFWVRLVEKNGEKFSVANGQEAELVSNDLKQSEYQVSSVEKKEFRRTPPPPFTTSTLQQAAANKLGWSAKRTMQVAQSLYEEGLITYHRTDSTNIAVEALNSLKSFIAEQFGDEYILEKPRFYKTKDKSAQEAHEAIRPTDVSQIPNSKSQDPNNTQNQNSKFSNREQERLYDLIWKRFVATQMTETKGETVKISVNSKFQIPNSNLYGLEAKGETVQFEGWLRLYKPENSKSEIRNSNDETEENEDSKQVLPQVSEGDKLEYLDLKSEQKFTQPPARYNDAGLIKKLEDLGIGRPSTYAPTLSTIQDRQYVEKVDKRFRPTAIGRAVNEFLVNNFPEIVDYQFTAKMEEELDEIAEGQRQWQEVMKAFYEPFSKKLDETGESAARVKIEVESTGEKCPTCGEGEVVVRTGRFGKFLSCSRYPDCAYKAQYHNKAGMKCPTCLEGDVIQRRTKTGRTFFGCSRYPQCNFASWNRPSPEASERQAAQTIITNVESQNSK